MSRVIAVSNGAENALIIQGALPQSVIATRERQPWAIATRPMPARTVIATNNRTAERQVLVKEPSAPSVIATQERPERNVIAAGLRGIQGLQGIPGPDGGSAFARIAGETISALRVVYELDNEVFYLDPADEDHIDMLLGISLTAATIGGAVNVQRSGILEDNSWSWALGRIWLGANGTLTQTPPAGDFDVLIGSAVSATRIILNIQDAILLEE